MGMSLIDRHRDCVEDEMKKKSASEWAHTAHEQDKQ